MKEAEFAAPLAATAVEAGVAFPFLSAHSALS
jgi:hypothetical protein